MVTCHSDLSTQTLIRSSGRGFFTVIACTSLLAPAYFSFSLSWPIQTKPSTRTFSYNRHSPRKITCPYNPLLQPTQANSSTRTSTFHQHLPHRLTCPYRRFLASVTAHTGQPVHMDNFFSLTQPTQAFSSMQTLSSFCRGLRRPTHPHGSVLLVYVKRYISTPLDKIHLSASTRRACRK